MSKRNFERIIESEKFSAYSNVVNITTATSVKQNNTIIFNNINDSSTTQILASTNVSSSIPQTYVCSNFNSISNSTNNVLTNMSVPNNSNHVIPDNLSLEEKLQNIIIKYHVSHNFVNELLEILRCEGLKLPKDVRTLLRTPKNHEILVMDPGTYIHLGIEFMLKPILLEYFNYIQMFDIIELGLNIDGLPITKSSKSCFWPILISFVNVPKLDKIVLPVGVYHGKLKKPNCITTFLERFIIEIKTILLNGICVNNKTFIFNISQVVCDAPAKAFILNVKSHNGYNSCNSCTTEGSFINNRMCFDEINAPLRTNESFRLRKDDEYHKGLSPLEDLPINITSSVVLDYMHNVCLGVVKRLLTFWVKGKKSVRFLNINIQTEVSSTLISLKPYLPSEFNRLPRSLEELEYWKATEFRTFLLYTGIIALKGRLNKQLFQHFMLLHSAIRILLSKETCLTLNGQAKCLLIQFVTEYSDLYGMEFISYNVHGLIHLPDFVLVHGPLDQFSAFKYENCLQNIKKCVKNSRHPLSDIYNRIIEQNKQLKPINNYPVLKKEMEYNPLICKDPTITLYEQIITECFIVSSIKEKDNFFFLTDNTLVKIEKIIKFSYNSIFRLEVIKYNNVTPMYNNPIKSDMIGCFYVETHNITSPFQVELNQLKYKCFYFQVSEIKSVAITLLHKNH